MKIIVSAVLILLSVCNASFTDEGLSTGIPSEDFRASLKTLVPKRADVVHANKNLGDVFGRRGHKVVLTPNYCELVHIGDVELMYSYYNTMFSVTTLAGYEYGVQVFYDYYGNILAGTSNWSYATVNGVLMMRHRYSDSKVYTDRDGQMIIFN